MRRVGALVLDRPWVLILAALAVLLGYWIYGTRVQTHEVKAGFSYAVNLTPGLDVRVSGIDAGKITSVDYEDGQAVVGLGIDDERVWPLHRGTRAILRWGTTAGNGTRFVQLEPGPKSAPEIPDGGIIPTNDTISPVEFDDFFNTFDTDTREHLQGFLRHGAETFDERERALGVGLRNTPPAFEAASGVFAELASNEQALRSLVSHTSRTTRILAREDESIKALITGMARTMDAFADHSRAMGTDIEDFPPTLVEVRSTLGRLDRTVDVLDGLVADIGPGARALRPLAATARPMLAELRATVPQALSTINAARETAPQITRLFRRGQPFAQELDPVLKDLVPSLACIRPYAPEFAGTLSTWASFAKNFDSIEHYARVRGISGPDNFASNPPTDSDEFVEQYGYTYAFPRPPGLASVPGAPNSDPQFMPECGVTRDALDPSKDPEDS